MSIAWLYQFLPWLNRVLWVAAGLLCGMQAAHWLAIGLESAPPVPVAAARQGAVANRPQEQLSAYSVILERNLFGVTPGALRDVPSPSEAQDGVRGEEQASVADLALLGTVAGGTTPLALLRSGGELLVAGLGDELPGGRRLHEVRRSEVVLQTRDGGLVTLMLEEGGVPARLERSTAPAEAASGGAFQVESLGENRWRIPKEEAERARSNLNALLKTARMTPNIVDGRTEGFQVVTVQPRSLLAQMGIRPRDVLIQINSVELDSPEKALQIFYQLREARSLSLSLLRNGQPLTFDYVVE